MTRKQIIDGLLQRHFGIGIEDTKLDFVIPDTGVSPFEEVNAFYDECDLNRIDLKGAWMPFKLLTLEDQAAIVEGWKIKEGGP